MCKKFKLNRTKIKGAMSCQSECGQVSLVFSVLYKCFKLFLTFFTEDLDHKMNIPRIVNCFEGSHIFQSNS